MGKFARSGLLCPARPVLAFAKAGVMGKQGGIMRIYAAKVANPRVIGFVRDLRPVWLLEELALNGGLPPPAV
jgi:hypothetical protein